MMFVGDSSGWGLVLVVGMAVLGHLTHLLKRVVEARATGEPETLRRYVMRYPYSVALGMIGSAAVMGLLIELGEVSLMAAFAAGYMADSGLEALRATRAGRLARGVDDSRGFDGAGFGDSFGDGFGDGGFDDGDDWQAGPVGDGWAGGDGGGPGGAAALAGCCEATGGGERSARSGCSCCAAPADGGSASGGAGGSGGGVRGQGGC